MAAVKESDAVDVLKVALGALAGAALATVALRYFYGGSRGDSSSSSSAQKKERKDLIYVREGTLEGLETAVRGYSMNSMLSHKGAQSVCRKHSIRVHRAARGGFFLEFEDKVHPYDFTQLLGWLDGARGEVGFAQGWFQADRVDSQRFYMEPPTQDEEGVADDLDADLMFAVSEDDGVVYEVFLPLTNVMKSDHKLKYVAENSFGWEAATFVKTIELKLNEPFSRRNSNFSVTHEASQFDKFYEVIL